MNYKVYSDITLNKFHKYLSAIYEKLRPDIILINKNVKEMIKHNYKNYSELY